MASALLCFRGSHRRHAVEGSHVNKGDPSGSPANGVGSNKPITRGRPEDLAEVRLADSTPRSGEPITWGSGQRELDRSWET